MNRNRCLLIAVWMIAGCAPLKPAPPPSMPQLDQSLAADCKPNGLPKIRGDYDSLQEWIEEVVLPNYADCAIRKRGIVEAWGK